MTTTTFSLVSENAFLSSLARSVVRLFTPAAANGPGVMSLYRMVGSGDTVRAEAIEALARMAK
ncbi:hypothetical protein [Massilia soli]|uniref:HEAT repeat domain-containing protein n=1 Tax=Massilia soli TaxID=2792854 RepID=A0ABS7SUB8_9BURK|nr:hypothetical protein [Massilia soli]MBZ2209532.1 hypothetical protein [Massilia soli]